MPQASPSAVTRIVRGRLFTVAVMLVLLVAAPAQVRAIMKPRVSNSKLQAPAPSEVRAALLPRTVLATSHVVPLYRSTL